jgi:hypothetical protein
VSPLNDFVEGENRVHGKRKITKLKVPKSQSCGFLLPCSLLIDFDRTKLYLKPESKLQNSVFASIQI